MTPPPPPPRSGGKAISEAVNLKALPCNREGALGPREPPAWQRHCCCAERSAAAARVVFSAGTRNFFFPHAFNSVIYCFAEKKSIASVAQSVAFLVDIVHVSYVHLPRREKRAQGCEIETRLMQIHPPPPLPPHPRRRGRFCTHPLTTAGELCNGLPPRGGCVMDPSR